MFRVGDEVICISAEGIPDLIEKQKYVVSYVYPSSFILVAGVYVSQGWSLNPSRFRKVQRRDLTEWLSTSTKNTDHIDKRKRVKA